MRDSEWDLEGVSSKADFIPPAALLERAPLAAAQCSKGALACVALREHSPVSL